MISSNLLNKRIRVTTRTQMADGRGGWIVRENELGTFLAAVLPLSVTERVEYQTLNASVTTKILVRYNPLFSRHCRIYFRNRVYDVQGIINPAYDDRFLELVVAEVVTP